MGLSLKLRFLASGALIIGVVWIFAALALRGQRASAALVRETLSRDVSALSLAFALKHDFVLYDDLVFRFLATGDEGLLAENRRLRSRLYAGFARLEGTASDPGVTAILARLKTESGGYFSGVGRILATAPEGVVPETGTSFFKAYGWSRRVLAQKKSVDLLSAKGRRQLGLVYSLCDDLVRLQRDRLRRSAQDIRRDLDRGELAIRRGGAAALAVVVLAGLLLALPILAPLRGLEAGIQSIMAGSLDSEIAPRGPAELSRITQAFNAMTLRLREKQEQLVKESITDALTGLSNFRHFQEQLQVETERAQRYGRPLSLLLIDVDHFKSYNDAHGHESGNAILQAVARILRDCLRPSDLLARYGGEEFVALLPEADKTRALAAAERLRQALAARRFPGQESQPSGR
ncbi:MAG: sensor domain-containing diguanylate cyclase, partial [Elusimicrobia bacterium]|nr:sensor domain-containing diguanylate cyclase [Elusimicrobiota bacterium]